MWLPEDERKLLLLYYKELDGNCFKSLPMTEELTIASIEAIGIPLTKQYPNNDTHVTCHPGYSILYDAHLRLQGRNLIKTHDYSDIEGMDVEAIPPDCRPQCLVITLEGSDFIRKYNNKFTRCGLWGKEYWCNPVLIIIGFVITYLAGICSAIIINKLTTP